MSHASEQKSGAKPESFPRRDRALVKRYQLLCHEVQGRAGNLLVA